MTDSIASLRQEARKAKPRDFDALLLRAWSVGINQGRPTMPPELKGCGDSSCVITPPKGQHTNGGCRCEPFALRVAIQQLKQWLRHEGDRRAAEMRERCARLMAGLLPTMDLHPDQVTYLVESLRGLPLERIAIRILNPVKP